MLVDVGCGSYVRARDVVAVHDAIAPDGVEKMKFDVNHYYGPKPECVIVLRNGQHVPGYFKTKTVVKRLRAAEGSDEDE